MFKNIIKLLIILLISLVIAIISFISNNRTRDVPAAPNISLDYKFKSNDEYQRYIFDLKDKYPSLVDIKNFRHSTVDDIPIYSILIGDTANKPVILLIANQHPYNEWIGGNILLKYINESLIPSIIDSDEILSKYSYIIIPIANPWGYFESREGEHHNGNSAKLQKANEIDWHSPDNYDFYYGVNLNRNYDWNWENFLDIPFSVKNYWDGESYTFANYFMMPYYFDEYSNKEIFDPTKKDVKRLLKPFPKIYDYKGEYPFSEKETQNIKYIFENFELVGFFDLHTMNPWSKNISVLLPEKYNTSSLKDSLDETYLSLGTEFIGEDIEEPKYLVLEEYSNNGPFASNWSVNKKNVPSFGWEIGTDYSNELLFSAYNKVLYNGLIWFDKLQIKSSNIID